VKIKYEEQTIERAWTLKDGKALIHLIPDTSGRMRGLHEIPALEQISLKTPQTAPLLSRKRSITRYRITERIHSIDPAILPKSINSNLKWIALSDLESLPFSGPHRRWITELLEKT